MMTTTEKLDNALAFAWSDLHEGDRAVILMQAKAACRTLAAEVERLRDELIQPRVRCANERQGSCRGFKAPEGA